LKELEVSESAIPLFFKCFKNNNNPPFHPERLVLHDSGLVDQRDFVAFFKRNGSGLRALSIAHGRALDASLSSFLPSLRTFSGGIAEASSFLTPLVDTVRLTFHRIYRPPDMSIIVKNLFNSAISPPRLRNLEMEVLFIQRSPMMEIFSQCPNLVSMKITVKSHHLMTDSSVSISS
jgi:hypothetical protein